MRRSWLPALLCLALGACAFGRAPVATELDVPDARASEDRNRLGYVGRFGEGASVDHDAAIERSRAAAELALRLGNLDEAGSFAREQLDLARARVLVERLRGDERSNHAAERLLDRAARFAVEVGDQTLDARLVLEAAQFMTRVGTRRPAIRRALTLAREADLAWGYERLWDGFAREPARLAELQRLRWRGHPASGMPIGASRASADALAGRGAEAVDLLRGEVDRAARDQRDEDLERWTDALLDADPHEGGALAIRVVLDALARGDLARDPELLPDLAPSGGVDPLGSSARMLARQRSAPTNRALLLARAQALLVEGSFGDTGQLIVEFDALPAGATKREQAFRDQLAARVALESGTPEGRRAYEDWARRRSARRSASLLDQASLHDLPQAPEPERELARASTRALIGLQRGRALPWLDSARIEATAIDGDAPTRIRERALAARAADDPSRGARLALCRERELVDSDCSDLLSELDKLDVAGPDYGAGLDALGRSANTRSEWFSPAVWLDADELRATRERLAEFEGTRVALTTDYQTAAIFAELAANRPDLARERLRVHGALLRPESAAVASMALRDLEEGLVQPQQLGDLLLELPPADVDASWMLERWLPGDPALVEQLFPGRSRLARFARGLALARMGAWRSAAAELLLTLEQMGGAGRPVVAGRLALAAQLADEDKLREQALGVLEVEQPGSFMLPFVRARAAEEIGQTETAHALYLEALLRRPRSSAALDGVLRTLPLGKQTVERVREVLALFPDSGIHWQLGELLDLASDRAPSDRAPSLDGPTLIRVWLARDDAGEALAIGEPAARWRTTGESGLTRLIELLQQAPGPDQAVPLAARTLEWLAAMPANARVQRRELELWLTFLVGRTSELEALTKSRPLYQGLREPSEPTHAALVLAQARDAGAVDDAMAWALVRDQLWSSEAPDVLALITELSTTTPADPSLAQFACMRMLHHDQYELAAERCVPVWNQLGGSRFLAVDFAFVALNTPDLLRAQGLEPAEVFEFGATIDELADDPIWLFNHSLWLASQGEHERAASMRITQLALGGTVGAALDDLEFGQARHRGPLLRRQLLAEFVPGDRRGWAVAAAMALRGLELRAATLYASRVLAWLPARDDEPPPDLTARAPQLLEAERLEGETSDADLRSMSLYVLHAAALIDEDLAAGRIEREDMHELMEAYSDEIGLAAYESVLRRAPDCLYAKLLVLSGYREARMRERAVALARELVALRPHDPLVLSEALPMLTGAEDLAQARTLLAEARALHPDHPWLRDDSLPAVLTGSDDRIPDWLRDPESFDRRLAAVDDDAVEALAPVRRFHTQVSAEAFFAGAATPNPGGELGVRQPIPTPRPDDATPDEGQPLQVDRVQFVVREPRASRCEGLGCAEPLIGEWTSRDYSLLWVRELELPAGPAIEFVVTDGESMVDNLLIPTGGNLFVLISGSSPEDYAAFLPAIKLLRESFRPLDFTLDAFSAETLRTIGNPMPDDRLRFQARRELARSSGHASCPIAGPLAGLSPATRGELLLDVLLTSRSPDQRRALLTCTSPDAPEAARLALPTLLDGHAAIHEFGRAATALHGDRVLADTRRILFGRPEAAGSDPALTSEVDNPPFGLLQVLAVLPPASARALTEDMLARSDVRLRSLALAASATVDYFEHATAGESIARTDPAKLRELVVEGSASEAIFASASLLDMPGAANLAALRERADALIASKADDALERSLAVDLAWAIAQQLDAGDRSRLRGLADAIVLAPPDDKPRTAERTRDAIDDIADDHEAGRKLVRASKVATDDESPSRWARARRTPAKPRSRETLAATPLAELLPGTDWTFVRVGNAGLFAAGLSDLLRRLAPGNPADAYLVRSIINDVLLQGFGLLEDEGGLDLAAGIECASPRGSEGFVCSAKVRDREALLSELAGRGLGDDAGVTIPLALVTGFAGLPVSLGALPVMLHGFIDVPPEDLDSGRAPELARERLRATRVIAGHPLEYYATVELREDSIVVDSEHYMILDDRLLVFSGAHLAELVLRELPKGNQSLAAAPAFKAASGRWREGMALQAVDLADTFGLDEVAIELVFTGEGLEFSAHTRGETSGPDAARDLARIDALLPGDPATHLAAIVEPDDLRESFEELDPELCDAGPSETEPEPCGLRAGEFLPPLELAEAASALALGWYAEPSEGLGLWQHWVLVMPIDATLRKAMSAAKLPALASDRVVAHAGRFWLSRDGALIVASSQALAEQAMQMASPAPLAAGEPRTFVAGSMHGQRAAKLVRSLADRYADERRGELLRILATMIGLIGEVELRGGWDRDGEGTLSASLGLNLAKSEEELALIDRWLADAEVGNAVPLPRHLGSGETDRPLELLVRVDDAEAFARASLPSNPRISYEAIADDRLRVTILPSSKLRADAGQRSLSKDERTRALASDDRFRAEAPAIREVADALIVEGDPAATVAAVVAWVHERIRYEITPTSVDALAILDRGKGDCTEYALLTVTLLRAAGIPAELREGMSIGGDEMVAHAWAAWHDGQRWNEIDPTAGTANVGAGHLEIEVIDVLALISLGRFEILEITPVS
ncbi:transglutaminase domain-containing protein [Nannocystaceae bacterium ST9]